MRFAWIPAIALVSGVRSVYNEAKCMDSIAHNDWEPIRIRFELVGTGIQSESAARIRNRILPSLNDYLTSAFSVRDRFPDNIQLQRTCRTHRFGLCVETNVINRCGDYLYPEDVEGIDVYHCPDDAVSQFDCVLKERGNRGSRGFPAADLVVYVASESVGLCASSGYSGYALECNRSACGRTNMGYVNICPQAADRSDVDVIQTILHEIFHVLGFESGPSMVQWIHGDGSLQLPAKEQFHIMYELLGDTPGTTRLRILTSIPVIRAYADDIRVLAIPYHAVRSIQARGFGKGLTCDCPTHPSDSFTETQLTRCLLEDGLRNCVMVVTTPRVLKTTQEYYNCDKVQGMELENQMGPDGSGVGARTMLNSHWKYKNLQGELMNGSKIYGAPRFISPLTLAFLEDSGWYRVPDYSKAMTALVEGIKFGYHGGCSLLDEVCVQEERIFTQVKFFPEAFEEQEFGFDGGAWVLSKCSNDGLSIRYHTCRHEDWKSVPQQYRYGPDLTSRESLLDFCPAYEGTQTCYSSDPSTAIEYPQTGFSGPDYTIRCSETESYDDGRRVMIRTGSCSTAFKCLSTNAYQVYSLPRDSSRLIGTCSAKGESFQWESSTVFCHDPQLVCGISYHPHIKFSNIDQLHDSMQVAISGGEAPLPASTKVLKSQDGVVYTLQVRINLEDRVVWNAVTHLGDEVALTCSTSEASIDQEYIALRALQYEMWARQVYRVFRDEVAHLSCIEIERLDLGIASLTPLSLFEVARYGLRMLDATIRMHALGYNHRSPGARTWLLRRNDQLVVAETYALRSITDYDKHGYHRMYELQQLVITLRYIYFPNDESIYALSKASSPSIKVFCPEDEDVCPPPLRRLVEYALSIDREDGAFDDRIYGRMRELMNDMKRFAIEGLRGLVGNFFDVERKLGALTPDPLRMRDHPLSFTLPGDPTRRWGISLKPIAIGSSGFIYETENGLIVKCRKSVDIEHSTLFRVNGESWAPHDVALVAYDNYFASRPEMIKCIRMRRYGVSVDSILLLTEKARVKLGLAMVDIIASLHTNHGIVHGDISADNWLIGESGLVLIDYDKASRVRDDISGLGRMEDLRKLVQAARLTNEHDVLGKLKEYSSSAYDDLKHALNPPASSQHTAESFGQYRLVPEAGLFAIPNDELKFRSVVSSNGHARTLICSSTDLVLREQANSAIFPGKPWAPKMYEVVSIGHGQSCLAVETLVQNLPEYMDATIVRTGRDRNELLMIVALRLLAVTRELHETGYGHREPWATRWMFRRFRDMNSLVLVGLHAIRSLEKDPSGFHRIVEMQQIALTLRYLVDGDTRWLSVRAMPSRNIADICPNDTKCPKPLRKLIEYVLSIHPERGEFPREMYATMRSMLLEGSA